MKPMRMLAATIAIATPLAVSSLARAADIVDRRYGWGGPAKNLGFKFWKDLGAAARAEGLTWGGDWRSFKDVAHVQR